MSSVQLGQSGIKVSRIGIGTYQATPGIWESDDDQIVAAIKRYEELGIDFIDTAEEYGAGHSEIVVGKAAKEIGRENVIIATKVYGPTFAQTN